MAHKTQLTLFVTFYVKPSMIEQFKAAHRPVWAACAAEPNCLLFDVFQHSDPSPDSSGQRFRLIGVWDGTQEWFEAEQLTKPYYATLWERSRPTWQREADLEFFERLGEGCSYRRGYLDGGRLMG